jgi:hypothetical protein
MRHGQRHHPRVCRSFPGTIFPNDFAFSKTQNGSEIVKSARGQLAAAEGTRCSVAIASPLHRFATLSRDLRLPASRDESSRGLTTEHPDKRTPDSHRYQDYRSDLRNLMEWRRRTVPAFFSLGGAGPSKARRLFVDGARRKAPPHRKSHRHARPHSLGLSEKAMQVLSQRLDVTDGERQHIGAAALETREYLAPLSVVKGWPLLRTHRPLVESGGESVAVVPGDVAVEVGL